MRVLVTIPHFYHSQAIKGSVTSKGDYGSVGVTPQPRIDALEYGLTLLQGHFGGLQLGYKYTDKMTKHPVNSNNVAHLDIVIVTTQSLHILDYLDKYRNCYIHAQTDCQPKFLGFECHRILKENLGRYDYYCYIEDDIIIHDSYLFEKIYWFNKCLGDEYLLQPNRYELELKSNKKIVKNYIDFEYNPEMIKNPSFIHFQNIKPKLTGNVMGKNINFTWAKNPHSGCFFLNQPQLDYWVNQPNFLDKDSQLFSSIDSSATLGLIKNFRIYKPAPENSYFLEVQHFGDAWSKKIMRVTLK